MVAKSHNGEFATLATHYTSVTAMRDANGPNIVLAGGWYGSSSYAVNARGMLWSSTAKTDINGSALTVAIDSGVGVLPQGLGSKAIGLNIRCINVNQ